MMCRPGHFGLVAADVMIHQDVVKKIIFNRNETLYNVRSNFGLCVLAMITRCLPDIQVSTDDWRSTHSNNLKIDRYSEITGSMPELFLQ